MQEREKVSAMLVPPTIDTDAKQLASDLDPEEVEAADRERMLKVCMLNCIHTLYKHGLRKNAQGMYVSLHTYTLQTWTEKECSRYVC